jgi:large-conductance mechanosensitive channel
MKGFKQFIEEQDVVAVGVGIVVGLAVKEFVEKFIAAFVTPIIERLLGGAGSLENRVLSILDIQFRPGLFISAAIDFFVVMIVVYSFVKMFSAMKYGGGNKKN